MNEFEQTLKIEPAISGTYKPEQLEEFANEDMKCFADFFTSQLGNSTPTDYENNFLKTYLLWKLGKKMTKEPQQQSTS